MAFARIMFFVLLAVTTRSALACRCVEPSSVARAYQRADIVVQASVLSVDGVGDSPDGAQVQLRIEEAWKADVAGKVSVSTSTTCAFDFLVGEDYLVFLYRDAGRLTTRICMGNRLIKEAAAALDWLHKHAVK